MAGVVQEWGSFVKSMASLIDQSGFELIYIKCGLPELPEWESILRGKRIVSWVTKYSGGVNAQLLASDSIDVARCNQDDQSLVATSDVASFAFTNGIRSVVDVCVGKGKMLKKFQSIGVQVAGIELCESRAMEAAYRLGVA
jgi:hypothetical protein